ncbi:nucleotide exchange factor GrpE [Actinomadura miaoliensis]|uniref:Protein GrpE n=1 Tax=Actinomadura miaoliensis TaxID=430685 RepID=A0ABP7X5G6_9ACTN
MTTPPTKGEGEEREAPVIRDRRRIDPETGKVREGGQAQAAPESAADSGAGAAAAGQAPAGEGASAGEQALRTQLDERTADLQRLKAEFDNYRKRVERDRLAVREQALANVLNELLPVLDDIGRAREHEELTGGFKSVGEALEAVVGKLGLEKYGEKGEPFDPTVHEALMHSYSPDVTDTTCVDVLQPGYRIGERVLRPARVAVAEPAPGSAAAEDGGTSEGGGQPKADDGE